MFRSSIIIPTYTNSKGLESCLQSIDRFTDFADAEVIVVANGAPPQTSELISLFYLDKRLKWFDEPIGFTKAANEGIKLAKGEFIVLLNDDTVIMGKDWLDILSRPFKDPKVGITGPMLMKDEYCHRDFIIFFCAMIRREVFDQIGILDEVFNPGFGEDCDFCARAVEAGWKLVQVPDSSGHFLAERGDKTTLPKWKQEKMWVGGFPIYHDGEQTFQDWKGGEQLLERNRQILKERYLEKPVQIERAKTVDGWMADSELRWLGEQAKNHRCLIEIGAWHGRSSRAMADNLPEGGRLYCVDHWIGSKNEAFNHGSATLNEGDHAFMEFSRNLFDHIQSGRVVPMRMSSKNAAETFKAMGLKPDMVFIDGGHTYEEVKEDILNWLPLVAEGGLICGHDYNLEQYAWVGVRTAVNEIFSDVSAIPNTSIWAKTVVTKRAMTYDCFPFFSELDLLELRLNELNGVVDKFVIVEGRQTYQGNPKPLNFEQNKARFEKFKDKIIYLPIDLPDGDAWTRERFGRDAIMGALSQCQDDDIIIIGDADEIPRAEAVRSYNAKDGMKCLTQNLYYYFLNCKADQDWNWQMILPYGLLKTMTPCQVRYTPHTEPSQFIKNGGWHFSFLGNEDSIIQKIKAWAHAEYNKPEFTDRDKIAAAIRDGKDIFGRGLTYKFVKINPSYPRFIIDNLDKFKERGYIKDLKLAGAVTAEISTKNRYFTTLPMAISSVLNQTRRPEKLVIFDDGEQTDLRRVSPYAQLFQALTDSGIDWTVISTPRKGQVANHQYLLETCNTEFIWRLDDDNLAQPECLQKLLELANSTNNIGAVGGLVYHPGDVRSLPNSVTGRLDDIFSGQNIQWFKWNGSPREVEHLYSTFLYRVEAGLKAGGYPNNLSSVGHREETIFSHNILRAGYKLLVTPFAVTWHLREPSGGIRTQKSTEPWEHDEKEFADYLRRVGVKTRKTNYVVLDSGLGDHLMFKQAWPKIKAKHKDTRWVLAVCYPQVFAGEEMDLISIADAKFLLGDNLDKYNAYKWAVDNQWKGKFSEVYERMYA